MAASPTSASKYRRQRRSRYRSTPSPIVNPASPSVASQSGYSARIVASVDMPVGVAAAVSGQSDDMQESFQSLQFTMLLAVFLVAAQVTSSTLREIQDRVATIAGPIGHALRAVAGLIGEETADREVIDRRTHASGAAGASRVGAHGCRRPGPPDPGHA